MMGRLYEKRIWRIACFGLLVFGLAMVGCNGVEGEAQAQTQWQITTFAIADDSFVFRSATTKPTIEVIEGTTIYTVAAGGAVVEYDAPSAGTGFIPTSPRTLLPGDQVIERPVAGLLTLIRLI